MKTVYVFHCARLYVKHLGPALSTHIIHLLCWPFLVQYVLFVNTMKDFSANHVRNLQQAFRGMAETYRVTASRSNMTWPYVTLPVMEVHGSHLREASGVELVTFAPVVTQEQRSAWRNWTWENQGWLNESYEIAEQQAASSGSSSNYESTSYQKGSISGDLFRRDGISPDFPIHFPIWQCSPPPFSSKFINYNIMGTSWMNDMLPALAIAKGRSKKNGTVVAE